MPPTAAEAAADARATPPRHRSTERPCSRRSTGRKRERGDRQTHEQPLLHMLLLRRRPTGSNDPRDAWNRFHILACDNGNRACQVPRGTSSAVADQTDGGAVERRTTRLIGWTSRSAPGGAPSIIPRRRSTARTARVEERLADRRQPKMVGQLDVVVPGHGQVAGHAHAERARRLEGSRRLGIARAHDRRRRLALRQHPRRELRRLRLVNGRRWRRVTRGG